MKVIIDISEGDYEMLKVLKSCGGGLHKSDLRILDGTPLPESHGRLIDADKVISDGIDKGFCDWYDEIKNADVILEADKGEEV